MEKKRIRLVRSAEKAEQAYEVGLTDILLIGAAIAGALVAFALVFERITRK